MKIIPAKNIQRITLIIAMVFGFNLINTVVFAQDANAPEKIQLLSEALYARDTGDLLLAKEKADMLIALAPEDENIQAFLLSINELIEKKGLIVPNKLPEKAKNIEEHIHHSPSNQASVDDNNVTYEEIGNSYAGNADLINELLLLAYSQLSEGDLAAASSTLLEIEARDPNIKRSQVVIFENFSCDGKVQGLNLYKTRESMLNSVDNSWDQPKVFEIEDISKSEQVVVPSLVRKIENIVLPKINFTGMALTRVIETLSELSLSMTKKVRVLILYHYLILLNLTHR